jgi:serine/threonine protein kinase/Tol biopolymer transport system component
VNPERWRHIERLYHSALERPSREREAFLEGECRGDEDLRLEVQALLSRAATAENVLDRPAAAVAAQMVSQPGAPILTGLRLGAYVVQAPIGAGGMGVVYRALDTNLNRPVAIKFLSDELADPAARRRFQREAQTASSLNHPHILTVHDAGEIEGRQYLVTELVDGGTLRDWTRGAKRGWRQTIDLLTGVADGLAAAHQAGILHRDIKPENILITKSGYAKLADFGLAKLHEGTTSDDATRTVTETRTRPGIIVGTVAYMSPEQASGQPLDARSDIFSFGVVLYEGLAGRRPFTGASDLDIVHAVVHRAADPLPEDVPLPLRMVVEKALEKDPADRFQSMRDMVVDLRRVVRQSAEAPPGLAATPRSKRPQRWLAAGAALVVVLAAVGALFVSRFPEPATSSRVAYTQLTFVDSASQPALSPNGRMMAFVRGQATFMGPGQIYAKLLPDGDSVQLTHDDLPKMAPRFSTDGARIVYSTASLSGWETWVVPVLGGQEPRRFLANAEGLTWIQERTAGGASRPRVLFSELTGKGITMAVVSATESRSEARTVYMREGFMEHFAYLSPDGKQLLLAEMGFNGWGPCRLVPYEGSSPGKSVGPAPAQCTNAAWSPDGKWMYFAANAGSGFHIWRQRFPDGDPEQVTTGPSEEEGIEFAPDGRSFLTSIGTRQSTLWIHDSRGDRQVASEAYTFLPSFSSDGKKLYYLVRAGGGIHMIHGGLWVLDLESGQRQRLLSDYLMQHYTVSNDGQRVVFVSANDKGRLGVWLATLDGRSAPRRLAASDGLQAFFGASGDVFFAAQEREGTFIYRVKEDGSDSTKVIPTAVYFLYGVSPDGKHVAAWVTGPTDETANAVMVYPVEGGSPTMICGTCGGRDSELPQFVSWSPDGKLLYLSIWGQATYAVPLRPGQILPALPAGGIQSVEDVAALPAARPFPVPGAFASPDPSVYAYSKVSAQRNIYRVPVP